MTRLIWQYMVVASILMSALVGFLSVLLAFRLMHYVPLLASLFAQAIYVAFMPKVSVAPLSQENLEVYKADTNRETALATNK